MPLSDQEGPRDREDPELFSFFTPPSILGPLQPSPAPQGYTPSHSTSSLNISSQPAPGWEAAEGLGDVPRPLFWWLSAPNLCLLLLPNMLLSLSGLLLEAPLSSAPFPAAPAAPFHPAQPPAWPFPSVPPWLWLPDTRPSSAYGVGCVLAVGAPHPRDRHRIRSSGSAGLRQLLAVETLSQHPEPLDQAVTSWSEIQEDESSRREPNWSWESWALPSVPR